MHIEFEYPVSADDRARLAEVLGCTNPQVTEKVRSAARAALEEYLTMFLGQKVFTRGSDLRHYRLLLLARHVFGERMPGEVRVSKMFQATATESRSLIRSVLSKYQYDIRNILERTLAQAVEGAEHDAENNVYAFTVETKNVVDQLNQILSDHDGALAPIVKKSGTVNTYVLQAAPREYLCERFNIQPNAG